jgi:hypothetical protein
VVATSDGFGSRADRSRWAPAGRADRGSWTWLRVRLEEYVLFEFFRSWAKMVEVWRPVRGSPLGCCEARYQCCDAAQGDRSSEVRIDRQSRQGPFAHRESGKQFAASGEDYAKAGRISAREISRDDRAAGMRRSSSPLCGRRGGHPLRSRLRRRHDGESPYRVDHSLGFSPWEPSCTRHRSLSAPPDKEDSPTSISRLTNCLWATAPEAVGQHE